jgi:excisionase family DNA binding protein
VPLTVPRSTQLQTLTAGLLTRREQNLGLLSESLFSVSEAALALDVTQPTIRRWIRRGQIIGLRTGQLGKFRIPAKELRRMKGQVEP